MILQTMRQVHNDRSNKGIVRGSQAGVVCRCLDCTEKSSYMNFYLSDTRKACKIPLNVSSSDEWSYQLSQRDLTLNVKLWLEKKSSFGDCLPLPLLKQNKCREYKSVGVLKKKNRGYAPPFHTRVLYIELRGQEVLNMHRVICKKAFYKMDIYNKLSN